MPPRRFYTKEQLVVMYELAKTRGINVDSMRWETFLSYAAMRAPDILDPHSSSCICHQCSALLARIRMEEQDEASLLFDGETLHWRQGNRSTSWPAVSGTEAYWCVKNYSIDAQKHKDAGPIPAGWYVAPQDRYQTLDSLWEHIKGLIFRGAWRGTYIAWGLQRVWLEPCDGTNTFGRSNFAIHGGFLPGSIGCIDLTENMPDFAWRFTQYGKNVRLHVEYKIDTNTEYKEKIGYIAYEY